jgi:hypothetical protein
MWIGDDGILRHQLDEGTVVTRADASAVWQKVFELCGTRPIKSLVDASGVEFADREARDAFSAPRANANEVATALIVGSLVSRTLGNMFLNLSKPKRPVKLFTDEAEGLAWLRRLETRGH